MTRKFIAFPKATSPYLLTIGGYGYIRDADFPQDVKTLYAETWVFAHTDDPVFDGDSVVHENGENWRIVRADHEDALEVHAHNAVGDFRDIDVGQLENACNNHRITPADHANYDAAAATLMRIFPRAAVSVFALALIRVLKTIAGTDNLDALGEKLNEWAAYTSAQFNPGARTTAHMAVVVADFATNLSAADFLNEDRTPNVDGGKQAILARMTALIGGWEEVSLAIGGRAQIVRLSAAGVVLAAGDDHYADSVSVPVGTAHKIPLSVMTDGSILKINALSPVGFVSLDSGGAAAPVVVATLPDGSARTVEYSLSVGEDAVWGASPLLDANPIVKTLYARLTPLSED